MKNIAFAIATLFAATLAQGQPTLLVTDDVEVPILKNLLMGSTENIVARYRLTNKSNEDVKIVSIHTFDFTTSNPAVYNFQTWYGPQVVGVAGLGTKTDHGPQGYDYATNFTSSIIVPSGTSITLEMRANVPAYATQAAEDNSVHRFEIASPAQVTAIGASSNQPATILAFAYGVELRILRSNLSLALMSNGQMAFSASQSGLVVITKLSATLPTWPSNLPLPSGIQLLDEDGVDFVAIGQAIQTIDRNVISWYFTVGQIVPAGATRNFTIQIPFPMRLIVSERTDVVFADGIDPAATTGLNLSGSFPIEVTRFTTR